MTLRGHIKDGKVVLDVPAPLPNGTPVQVRAAKPAGAPKKGGPGGSGSSRKPPATPKKKPERVSARFGGLIGRARNLPPDLAAQHDHYVHGARKR